MDEILRRTWEDVAACWNDYDTPLRPHPQDVRMIRHRAARWHAANRVEKASVFLCGVTPEIATMDWPFPIEMIAMDQAQRMVDLVWPGDVPGVRKAIVGNWRNSGLADASQDIVIGDGGLGFFSYPDDQRELARELRRVLRPAGLFVYRHYAQLRDRESMSDVLDDMRHGRIGNFHVFKWRLAMAMQSSSTAGVKQSDIWQAVMHAGIDQAKLPRSGWSAAAINTIHFYRGKDSRLFFPTLDEFRLLLSEMFESIEVEFPTYELGERCPLLSCRAR